MLGKDVYQKLNTGQTLVDMHISNSLDLILDRPTCRWRGYRGSKQTPKHKTESKMLLSSEVSFDVEERVVCGVS